MPFADIETYSAYCQLVVNNIIQEKLKKQGVENSVFANIAKEFVEKIKGKADECSPEKAKDWCKLLLYGPLRDSIDGKELLSLFTIRIQEELSRAKNGGREAVTAAIGWLRFIKEFIGTDRVWAKESLESICSEDTPVSISKRGFEILRSFPQESSNPFHNVDNLLTSIELPPGKDIWSLSSFRQALWSCLTVDSSNAKQVKVGKEAISKCLLETLDIAKTEIRLFEKWVTVFIVLKEKKLT